MDTRTMPWTKDAEAAYKASLESIPSLKPALAPVKASCQYLGGISRAKFYADILPLLKVVKLGSRTFIVVESMDRLIETQHALGLQKGGPRMGSHEKESEKAEGLIVTYVNGKPQYATAAGGVVVTPKVAERLINNRELVGDEEDSLFGCRPQRYRVPKS